MLDPGVRAGFIRRRIADAMAELCVELGYRRTTVDQVARRAGVGRGTIYAHFANREEVFFAVLDRGAEELLERAGSACQEMDGGSEARIEAGLAAVLTWAAEEPEAAWVCFVESLSATSGSLQLYLDTVAAFTTMLRDAGPAEVPRPETTEELLVGGIASVLSNLIRAGEVERAPELLPALTRFLRGPVRSRSLPNA